MTQIETRGGEGNNAANGPRTMNMLSAPEHEASQFESSPPGGQTIRWDPSSRRFSDAYQESNHTGWFHRAAACLVEFLERAISGTAPQARHRIGTHRVGQGSARGVERISTLVGVTRSSGTRDERSWLEPGRPAARRVQSMMRRIVGASLQLCFLVAFTCLGLSSGAVMAQDKKVGDFDPKSFT